jgi:signal transduction histidine kinase
VTGGTWWDWAGIAVSLFNTIMLGWLGLTVLLNAERRNWGIWLTGGSLLLGAAFFVSHTAILSRGLGEVITGGVEFWWHVGWIPVVVLPASWYVVVLWYAGFWEDRTTKLYRRHRWILPLIAAAVVGMTALLVFGRPLPTLAQLFALDLHAEPSVAGVPLLMLVYPAYAVACLLLAFDALRHPGPSARVMGPRARARARPWLVATAFALLGVGLLVAWILVRTVLDVRLNLYRVLPITMQLIIEYDLLIATLIAIANLTLGRAVVAYEIFTGKILPRHGLQREWQSAVLLAAGYSVLAASVQVINLRLMYTLLLTAGMLTAFHALSGWRTYAARERAIAQLRPFVASERLYDQLSAPAPPSAALGNAGGAQPPGAAALTDAPEVDVLTPFHALCRDVLGARTAYLAAAGPLAPLAGPPLAYPAGRAPNFPPLGEIVAQAPGARAMSLDVDPLHYGGAEWAVPLWGARGVIGVLLLGPKVDGALYTQEEIEIARTSGERLLDTKAGAEMARRLMALQRQRLAESQLLDRRTRRVLHDDVLPRLHAALLALDASAAPETMNALTEVHRRISDLLREMPATTANEVARLGLAGALRRVVDEELAGAFDDVLWEVDERAAREAATLPPLTGEVLFYAAREALRNAARHGRGDDQGRALHLALRLAWRDGLELSVEDDGTGLAASEPALPGRNLKASAQARGGGFEPPGSGQGLALHGTLLAVVGGALAAESAPGRGTRVTLTLPRGAWE